MEAQRLSLAMPAPFARLGRYIQRALHAASFPIYGVYYFIRRPFFYPLFLGRLLPLSIISFLVYTLLFTFAFLPQFAFLALFHGWGAWVNAVVLVLGEGLVITQGLFEGFFVDECRVDVFDGHSNLVSPQRMLFPDAATPVRALGRPTVSAAYQPWSLIQIAEIIVCLPLNLIPFVGMPAFIIITGSRLGKLSHYRWYNLHGLTRKERNAAIRARAWEYTWFGTVAMLLELVPILSFFFLLTTTAGSALWAAEMESQSLGPGANGSVPPDTVANSIPGHITTNETSGSTTRTPVADHYEDDPV